MSSPSESNTNVCYDEKGDGDITRSSQQLSPHLDLHLEQPLPTLGLPAEDDLMSLIKAQLDAVQQTFGAFLHQRQEDADHADDDAQLRSTFNKFKEDQQVWIENMTQMFREMSMPPSESLHSDGVTIDAVGDSLTDLTNERISNINPINEHGSSSLDLNSEVDDRGDAYWLEKLRTQIKERVESDGITNLWIFNGGEAAVGLYEINEDVLLSYDHVHAILDSIESCEERDELIMKKSSGTIAGYTSLYWACGAASNTPSDDAMRLVELLIDRVSNANRKQLIESVKVGLYRYSDDIRCHLLDNYDGDVISLSASPDLLSDDVCRLVVETIEDRYDDIQQAFIEFSTTNYLAGMRLIHNLTASRRESLLCMILKRLSLQSRRHVLTCRDVNGVTPLYMSRHGREIREMLPTGYYKPGGVYYPDDISDSLVKMLNFFCNEYNITSGVNLINYTVDTTKDADNMTLSTYSSRYYHHHDFMENKLSHKKDVMLMISTKYVEDVTPVKARNFNSLVQDMSLYYGYTYKIVLLQMIVKSPPCQKPSELINGIEVMELPGDVVYWFIYTCTELRTFIQNILRNWSGLFSVDQQLALTRRALQRHQSVIYVSSLQSSSMMRVVSSPAPVKFTVVSHDEISINDGDDTNLVTHTYDAGSALIMVLNVRVDAMADGIIDLMKLPALRFAITNDTLPKVVFIQFIVKDSSLYNRDIVKNKELKIKPFALPTDYSLCFAYTTQDLSRVVKECLARFDCMTIQQRLSKLRQRLVTEREVIYVSAIYSSLGRRLTLRLETEMDDGGQLLPYPCATTRLSPLDGSALIIYTTADRSCNDNRKKMSKAFKPGENEWRGELNNAEYILKQQMGLKTELRKDLGSREILSEVKNFAERTSGDDYSVLAIMSHGDEKDQIIAGDDTTLSVQEVVDSFSHYGNHPKIVILQYCRGPNRYSQLPSTHEERHVKDTVRQRPKMSEYKSLAPSERVIPPPNFFVVYSTSTDSRSSRGLLFKCMKAELFDKWQHKQPPRTVDLIDMMIDVAGSVREKSLLYQHLETVDTLCRPVDLSLYPHEEPDEDCMDFLL